MTVPKAAPPTRGRRAGLVTLLFAGLACLWTACAATEDMNRERDLRTSVSRHHLDLRWGRVPNAAVYVHPDLQPGFIEDWTRFSERVDLTDIDVQQILESGDGRQATVVVRMSWIDRASQRVETAVLDERWELLDDGQWVVTRVLDPTRRGGSPAPTR